MKTTTEIQAEHVAAAFALAPQNLIALEAVDIVSQRWF